MIELVWPGDEVPTDGTLLLVHVRTPHDQADLHRLLGKAGYLPECQSESETEDVYLFRHPDGER